jgi:rare lipoprotein A
LLVLNKIIIISFALFLLVGCSSKKNNHPTYKKKYNKTYPIKYKNIKKEKIRNSKAMHRATMRSYYVLGKRYYPQPTYIGEQFEGRASWYGPDFHAKKTSNGETYNMYAQTAASKTLPMNTMVKVYNKDNGLSTIVRINDRGPFVKGRIIDLSNKAAHDIDMVGNGTANVLLTVVGKDGKILTKEEDIKIQKHKNLQIKNNYLLQVGAYGNKNSAFTQKENYDIILGIPYKAKVQQSISNGKQIYKVLITGFKSEIEADKFRNNNDIEDAIIIAQ